MHVYSRKHGLLDEMMGFLLNRFLSDGLMDRITRVLDNIKTITFVRNMFLLIDVTTVI